LIKVRQKSSSVHCPFPTGVANLRNSGNGHTKSRDVVEISLAPGYFKKERRIV
jgi:hypothetical protein